MSEGTTGRILTPQSDVVSFGSFQLFPAARALEKSGVPLTLGNRALDILMVLVERAGEVVSHKELIARSTSTIRMSSARLPSVSGTPDFSSARAAGNS